MIDVFKIVPKWMTIPDAPKPISDFCNRHFILLMTISVLAMISFMMVYPASAVPTTNAATDVTSNAANLSCTGITGTKYWFEWGQNSGNEYWKTPNKTTATGDGLYRISQSPLFGSTVFYFRACDETGCGNEQSFFTLPVTPIPEYGDTLGTLYNNITESGYNIQYIGMHLVDPLQWSIAPLTPPPLTVIFMLIFSPIFIGVWLRSRTVLIALILGFITGGFIMYSNYGLGLSMPPEIIQLAQAIVYVSFAGVVLYVVKR